MTDQSRKTPQLPIKTQISANDRVMFIYGASNAQAQTATITFGDLMVAIETALANT